ncbi:ABC transporter ATP-binding protein [Amycolatopsis suaedae]|uniref:ABC transporter ATP-binding protein n=1 Tax=Amycolatopsis suaedae TaxID=2510978 RepID=A0A4Q7JCC0_9PSEU|nr:ABC transporter ATP-binding protein [Amycolatopsis suaedae]RZQ64778.1 ABC transporter ATP-binding protein [Amycolatopsis suaedae]
MGGKDEPPLRWQNVRVLWSFVRPHRGKLLLGLVLGLIATGATLATPMVAKWVLDGMAESAPIGAAVAILVTLLVAGSVIGLWQGLLLGKLAENIVLDARTDMVRRLFRIRMGELAKRSGGEFVTRVTSDSVLLREAAGSGIQLVNGAVGVIGSLVLMAALDWVLLATTIGALGVVGAVAGMLMPQISAAHRDAQDAVGRMGGLLEGALRAIRTVKASRAEHRESGRVLAEAQESARKGIRAARITVVNWTLAGAGIQLAILLILALGAWRVSEGALAVSSLVAFLLYAFQLMEPVEAVTRTVGELQAGVAAAARIREVQGLDVEPEGRTTAAAGAVDGRADTVLSFRDVVARYAPGAEPALRGVSLDIARTGHTAIVGPSGAGKTTMFSLMLRFLQPESGTLTLDGVPFDQWSVDDVRRRIVYVEQDTPLVPGTVRDNLTYTHTGAGEDALWAALREVRLDERVRSLPQGLDTPLSGATVSGGERQRIALARALVGDPEILLLDEATAQLDGLTEAAVHTAIDRIASTGAVVTIAHRLSTVIDADRIFVMEDGLCRAAGTHHELLESDVLYRDLVEALKIASVAAPAA